MSASNGQGGNEPRLRRELGVFGAVMMGLGSIVGTGVFVSIGLAAGIAGPAVMIALALAALLAMCNAFSSAQLAADHPVSGGTYEYGYRYLTSWLGFAAGWMFLCAKSASAATAALGFAGYLLRLAAPGSGDSHRWLVAIAVFTVVALTIIVLSGMRRTNHVNIAIVSVTLTTLAVFIAAGLPMVLRDGGERFTPFFDGRAAGFGGIAAHLMHATALMFVAYTGYGRIATLGEEVREPRRTIPRAIVITLIISAALYIAVAAVAIGAVGAADLGRSTDAHAAPLEAAASAFDWPAVRRIVTVGAMTAMLGVLLNLILGLSRVLLAMGRRGDMPAAAARLNSARTTPHVAVIAIGALIAALTLIGSVRIAWSFSAFTVLVYYAITNLAALRLEPENRLYHPAFAWAGLSGCLFLAFWVEWSIWLTGLGVLGAGLVWHAWASRRRA